MLPATAEQCRRLRSLERGEERADLVVDLGRVVDGGGDLLAEQHAVAAAKAMDGDPDGPLGAPEPRGDRRVRGGFRAAGQDDAQLLEGRRLAGVLVLPAELVEDPAQQRQRPAPVEDPLRGQLVGRLAGVSSLGVDGVDREDRPAAPALAGVLPVALVGEIAGADAPAGTSGTAPGRGRPWRAGPAPARRRRSPGSGPGPARGLTPAPDIGVEGIPVGVAERGEGLPSSGASGSPAAITRLQWVVGNGPGMAV